MSQGRGGAGRGGAGWGGVGWGRVRWGGVEQGGVGWSGAGPGEGQQGEPGESEGTSGVVWAAQRYSEEPGRGSWVEYAKHMPGSHDGVCFLCVNTSRTLTCPVVV